MLELPKLYKKTSTGKIQTWKISTDENEITTVYGLQLGKKQIAREVIASGKNVGKANETTPVQQAEFEARAQWEQKVKKGYVEKVDDAHAGNIDTNFITGGIEPMLAHKYEDQGHKIHYPAYVQPKLDGHRCIAIIQDGVCTLWSRTRKPILSMPHIVEQLETVFPGSTMVLDGELYNHDYRDHFEDLTSLIRQSKPMPGHEVVQYWVYDIAHVGPTFTDRANALTSLVKVYADPERAPSIAVVDTQLVEDEEAMITTFGVYMEFGFEGLMVRNADGIYRNKRSYDLQKVKMMQDAEFEIIDITEGRGKMAGKAMFHCVTADGKEFRVKMKGTLDSLSHYLDHKDDYIGRELTVKYQNLSADGIPRFPIGERIREDV